MSKSDLKTAMQSLQVNKPLRLQARAPSFVAPAPTFVNPTEVENTTPVAIPTQVELQTQAAKVTPVELSTVARLATEASIQPSVDQQTQVPEEAQATVPTKDHSQTEVQNETQVVNEHPVSITTVVRKSTQVSKSAPNASSRQAIEQDSSVVLEARASAGLEKGYTRLPNTVLMKMAHGDLTRSEIKILLLIARFTISFQRKLAPLSKTVLERQSGLRGAAVLEALSGLVSKQLIIKEQGDQHRPNMLGLVLPSDWDQLVGTSETPVAKSTLVQKQTQAQNKAEVTNTVPVANQTLGEVEKTTPAPVGNTSPFKDTKIYSNKNSHSPLPELLQKYFDELKPAKKRESELKAFQELCEDYSSEDIVDCLTIVLKRGVGSAGQPCHSPMAFLSKAMDSVFVEVEETRKRSRAREDRDQREADAKRLQTEKDAQEAADWAVKESAFIAAFPSTSEQTEILAQLCANLPFKLSGELARVMGIGKWLDQKQF
jgi:phage replication O-like protein O